MLDLNRQPIKVNPAYSQAFDIRTVPPIVFVRWMIAVELLNFSRLLKDDFHDRHTTRWLEPSLRVLLGEREALAAADVVATLAFQCVAQDPQSAERAMVALARYEQSVSESFALDAEDYSGWERGTTRSLSTGEFRDRVSRKHCSGKLVHGLVVSHPGNCAVLGADKAGLLRTLLQSLDIAGGVYNDWSEITGMRGHVTAQNMTRVSVDRGPNEVLAGAASVARSYVQTPEFIQTWLVDHSELEARGIAASVEAAVAQPGATGLAAYVEALLREQQLSGLAAAEKVLNPQLDRIRGYFELTLNEWIDSVINER